MPGRVRLIWVPFDTLSFQAGFAPWALMSLLRSSEAAPAEVAMSVANSAPPIANALILFSRAMPKA